MNGPLTYQDFREAAHKLATRRRSARELLEQAVTRHADAEAEYRKARALAYVAHRDAANAGERDAQVDAATADLRRGRDVAKGMIDAARELLAEVDAERASLHRLADWALRVDPTGSEDRDRKSVV